MKTFDCPTLNCTMDNEVLGYILPKFMNTKDKTTQ